MSAKTFHLIPRIRALIAYLSEYMRQGAQGGRRKVFANLAIDVAKDLVRWADEIVPEEEDVALAPPAPAPAPTAMAPTKDAPTDRDPHTHGLPGARLDDSRPPVARSGPIGTFQPQPPTRPTTFPRPTSAELGPSSSAPAARPLPQSGPVPTHRPGAGSGVDKQGHLTRGTGTTDPKRR